MMKHLCGKQEINIHQSFLEKLMRNKAIQNDEKLELGLSQIFTPTYHLPLFNTWTNKLFQFLL